MRQIAGAREQPPQEIYDQRQPVSLVAAHWQEEAVERGFWIDRRMAGLIRRPVWRDRFAPAQGLADLGAGDDTHSHVEDDRLARRVGDAETDRTVAEPCV